MGVEDRTFLHSFSYVELTLLYQEGDQTTVSFLSLIANISSELKCCITLARFFASLRMTNALTVILKERSD